MNRSRKYFSFFAAAAAVVGYLMVPACGNNSSNNPGYIPPGGFYPTGSCVAGMPCTNPYGGTIPGGVGGAVLPAPAVASLDYQGSAIMLSFTGGSPSGGQVYVTGQVTLAPGSCAAIPQGGTFPVQGSGQYQPGYGGAVAGFQGTLQMAGGAMVSTGILAIRQMPDPNNPPQAFAGTTFGYWMGGSVQIANCGTYTAL